VFTVIDGSPSTVGEKKAIVCVGINFGQGTGYLGGQRLTDPTGLVTMRNHLQSAFCANKQPRLSEFHLVAANFFPWISKKAWGQTAKESIDEAVLLIACGYSEPISVIADLVNQIQPSYLVFHGVGNCVTVLGTEVIRTIGKGSCMTSILTGNLAYNTDSNFILLT
jgi:hypothetical protein